MTEQTEDEFPSSSEPITGSETDGVETGFGAGGGRTGDDGGTGEEDRERGWARACPHSRAR